MQYLRECGGDFNNRLNIKLRVQIVTIRSQSHRLTATLDRLPHACATVHSGVCLLRYGAIAATGTATGTAAAYRNAVYRRAAADNATTDAVNAVKGERVRDGAALEVEAGDAPAVPATASI